jgi:hypothetical protein
MVTDVGEYLVGAYLQLIDRCDFVQYNVRPPHGGLEGLGELDVVGFNFATRTAYLCEVTTHIRGLQYGTNPQTVQILKEKHERQKAYALRYLTNFENLVFQFWSPVVPVGFITSELASFPELNLIINAEYTRRVRKLQELARSTTHDARNPVFRLMQILEHLRITGTEIEGGAQYQPT